LTPEDAGQDQIARRQRRIDAAAVVESGRRSVRWHGARSTAWRIVLRPEHRYQALRLKAHRCAAVGLDSGTPAELLASMPFDRRSGSGQSG